MPRKHCAYSFCSNNSTHYKDWDCMKGVKFFLFPSPNLDDLASPDTVKCYRWITLCGRSSDLTLDKINEDKKKYRGNQYYQVCSKVRICCNALISLPSAKTVIVKEWATSRGCVYGILVVFSCPPFPLPSPPPLFSPHPLLLRYQCENF